MNAPENENEPVNDEPVADEANVQAADVAADDKPKDVAKPKSKLGLILGLFVVAAGAILLTQYVLKSQIPKGDTEYQRDGSNGEGEITPEMGGAPRAPAM